MREYLGDSVHIDNYVGEIGDEFSLDLGEGRSKIIIAPATFKKMLEWYTKRDDQEEGEVFSLRPIPPAQ